MKKSFKMNLLAIIVGITIVGCATKSDPTQRPPGFLQNYSILHQVPTDDSDAQLYVYRNPEVKRSDYHAVIVEPVTLYQTATESGVTQRNITAAKDEINNEIKQTLGQKYPITTTAGKGVARLNIAITGALIEKDGFKPRNIIPISAAIKLASMATGLDGKKPVLIIETKVTDSKTNHLLSASVATIGGEKFRTEGATKEAFIEVAKEWVSKTIKYAAGSDQQTKPAK